MNKFLKKIISLILVMILLILSCSCSVDYEISNQKKFSITENAEINGEYKNKFPSDNAFIEVNFTEIKEFNTVIIEENDSHVLNFSIQIKDDSGEYRTVYEQDRIGAFRYCDIGRCMSDSLRICFNSVSEDYYSIKNIDILNVDRVKRDFRVNSYIVCPTFYSENSVDIERTQVVTDAILFGVARFNENGEVFLQGAEINGSNVSGEEILSYTIESLKKANSSIKIYCNILGPDGSDSEDKEKLHSIAFTDNKDALSKNIIDLLSEYGFDGIFFDYEYPYKNKSRKDFSDFLVHLDSLLDTYILGASLSEWCCDLSDMAIKALDRVEIMAYDDMETYEGSHAEFSSKGGIFAIESFIKQGYDLSKCDLGLPFYGRTHGGEEAWPSYAAIVNDITSPFENAVDRFYINGGMYSEGISTSFNGVQMIKDKTSFAFDYGLGGVMVWHYSCDVPYNSELSLFRAIHDSINR